MSDDKTPPAANGAAATDHPDSAVVTKLRSKIQVLEQELANDKLKIKNLEDEISYHESDKHALTLIAFKTSELETQFSSLQHDLISSASDLNRKVIEFEAKERENVEKMSVAEIERNLLLEKLKESEEKRRELQIVSKFDMLVKKLGECEAKARENSDRESELEARYNEKCVKMSELDARRRIVDDKLSETKAKQRKLDDRSSELEARKRKIADKLSERDAREHVSINVSVDGENK